MNSLSALWRIIIAGLFLAGVAVLPALADRPKIVVLGDSLVAGYQLAPGQGFPDQLQARLDKESIAAEIIAAGVSGDTTSGGLARLDWSVGDDVAGVILELGANDALRGLPPAKTRENLVAMISKLKARGIRILLVGMMAPPNMGEDYASEFNPIYQELAREHKTAFYPFFLDGVAAQPELNLPDGIHPNDKGVKTIVERILPTVHEFIESL